MSTLIEQDIRNLEQSFITPELAEAAGLFRVSSIDGANIIGRSGSGDYAGVVFPYFWPGEDRPREYRLRRDRPEFEQKPGGVLKEKNKYMMPPGRGNMLYFMPRTPPELLDDATLPIAFTEGEKKGIALYRLSLHNVDGTRPRFLSMSVPGCWNWRATREFIN